MTDATAKTAGATGDAGGTTGDTGDTTGDAGDTAGTIGTTVSGLVDATPADRDRFVDFLRAASICLVVLGHWTISAVTRDPDGSIAATSALGTSIPLQLVTWIVQVMPVFFFVGGFSNLLAIDRQRSQGGTYASYLNRRLSRLLPPTLLFVAVWLAVATLLGSISLDPDLVRLASLLASQPLWFLAVYVLVVAAAPPMAAWHRRSRYIPPAALLVAVVALDMGRLSYSLDGLAMANYILVFLFAQQAGFFYGDGSLVDVPRRALLGTSAVALAVLWLLVTVGPYPLSMVGVPGEALSNMSPPTVCIVVLTVAQVSALMALRPVANAWLARRKVWAATVVVNARIMTLFLWHLTAMLVAGSILLAIRFPLPSGGTAGWWATRPVWIACSLAVLSGAVAAFGWAERSLRARPIVSGDRVVTALAVAGLLITFRGLVGLALDGFAYPLQAPANAFLGMTLCPLADAGLLLAGYIFVVGLPSRR